ncbi:unnamed protein product [Caenorhabditis brenneri]
MSSPARDDEPTSSNTVDLPDFAEDLSMDSNNVSSSQADSTSTQAAPKSLVELPTEQEPDSTEALDMTTAKSQEPESTSEAADAVSTSDNVADVKPDTNTSNEAEAEQKVVEEVEDAEKEVKQDDVTGSSDSVQAEKESKEEAELADTTNQEAADTGSEKTESVEDEKEKGDEAAAEADTSEKMEVDEDQKTEEKSEKTVEKADEKTDEKTDEKVDEKTEKKTEEEADDTTVEETAEKSEKKSGKKAGKKAEKETNEQSDGKETESTSKDSGKRKVKAEVKEHADRAPVAKQAKIEQEEEEQELMLQKEKPIKAEVTDPAAIALQKEVQTAIKLYQKYQDEKHLVQRLAVPNISPYVMAVGTKQLTENFNRVAAFQKRADEASTVEEFKPLLEDLESNIRRARQSQEINNLLGHLF